MPLAPSLPRAAFLAATAALPRVEPFACMREVSSRKICQSWRVSWAGSKSGGEYLATLRIATVLSATS